MNKKIVVERLATKLNIPENQARLTLNAVLDVFSEMFYEYDQIQLVGFGRFFRKQRAKREGRNPKTGEVLTLPEKTVIRFKVSENLENSVDQSINS